MISPTQIRKPENWQDFEKLCKKLWGELWNCSDTIQRNGRNGQNQCGVDIYCIPNGEEGYYGIQCKGKDDYIQSQLTEKEIEEEINKARNFRPHLKRFVFATTANKDAKIEEFIRIKNLANKQQGLFEIYVSSWEDIVDLLEERRATFNWYVNNCQYKDLTDVSVFVNWDEKLEIKPIYIRTTKTYSLKIKTLLDNYGVYFPKFEVSDQYSVRSLINPPTKFDNTWCTIPVNIINTGSTVLEDYKLYLIIESDKIEDVDDKFHYFNNRIMDQAAVAQINTSKDLRREVYESSEYANVLEFRPLETTLVQTDSKTFNIGIKPKIEVSTIKIQWRLKSRNYQKEGELTLLVDPQFEDITENIYVENETDLKDDEIIIKAKITEKYYGTR